MGKVYIINNDYVVAKVSSKYKYKLDYYLIIPGRGYEYAFTKKYKKSCYIFCKSPILLNKVLYNRSHNTPLMILKKYFHHNMSYLVDCLELDDFVLKRGTKNKYYKAA